MKSNAEAAVLSPARTRTADFVALAKPRLNLLVVGSALAGYAMAGGDMRRSSGCCRTVLGTALVAGGASAYNQILERDTDALMQRTRLRPLPDGRLQVGEALIFATALSSLGLATLAAGVNTLCALVALATLVSYVVIYTPLKRVTSFATVIGAIPGALPPVIGWAAAPGGAEPGRLAALRHRLPLAAAALPVDRLDVPRGLRARRLPDAPGPRTGRPQHGPPGDHLLRRAVPLSLAPTLIGLTGRAYFIGALGARRDLHDARGEVRVEPQPRSDARRLFFGSIIYLPLLWILMIANRV